MKPLSIQLYTLRDVVNADFPAVLRRVVEIGYKGVEFAGLHGIAPAEIAAILADAGLQVSSSHVGIPTRETIAKLADTEKTLGNTNLVAGFGPDEFKTLDDCKRSAEKFQTAGELAGEEGLTFAIHNHWWEFQTVDGHSVYDYVLENAPAAMGELDIYWAAYAGASPAEVISKHKSRLPLLHIKDGSLEKDSAMTAVGSGKVDIKGAIAAADPDVLQWLIVELDRCDTDMWDAVSQSYTYLTQNGLAAGNK